MLDLSHYLFSCFHVFMFQASAALPKSASMYLAPAIGTYNIGDNFTVMVNIASPETPINAVAGVLYFPADLLSVNSVSADGSLINLWVQQPAYDNVSGRISFQGIIYDPGYQGGQTKILTINFQAKKAGIADVPFASGSILANDGFGTNVLASISGGVYALGGAKTPSETAEEAKENLSKLPAKPVITSPTQPDQNKWYAMSTAVLEWKLPAAIKAANAVNDQQAATKAGTKSQGLFATKNYGNLPDGVWYFHLRLENSYGWSQTASYKYQLDTHNPETLNISQLVSTDPASLKASFNLSGHDALSGLDYFSVKVDNGDFVRASSSGSCPGLTTYETADLAVGNHLLTVRAYDRAGNYTEKSLAFAIGAAAGTAGQAGSAGQEFPAVKFCAQPFTAGGCALAIGSYFSIGCWWLLLIILVILIILLIILIYYRRRYSQIQPDTADKVDNNLRP